MLSVASLSSAGQAGSYYTKDNYYTQEDARQTSAWEGEGARRLGLEGKVEVEDFKAILSGELPDGTKVGEGSGKDHRPGMDLTFSAPKSVSLVAYVGGDERLLDANLGAVRDTLRWAEANLAEARVREQGQVRVEKTGNLVIALFQHDTNRNLDPQAHIHAVVANLTQTEDGKWRALRNDQLWKQNSLLGAIYHAYLRERIEALGYETELTGKHGTFEIAGVPRDAIEAFSTRRQEILERAGALGVEGREGLATVTLTTRPSKTVVEDRSELRAAWEARAAEVGLDLEPITKRARDREERGDSLVGRLLEGIKGAGAQLRALIGLTGRDPERTLPFYTPAAPQEGKAGTAAAVAVAAAIRHLAERETSFSRFDIARAALHLGMGVTIDGIDRAVTRLERRGMIIEGKGEGLYTTPGGIATEQRILAEVDQGRGATTPILEGLKAAGERLQAQAMQSQGFTLNQGQEAAGRLLLASHDRIVTVQGVAGAGKSSVLAPVAEIARAEGRNVIGLGVQNKLVAQLRNDTGIEAMTVARFLGTHGRLLDDRMSPERLALARAMFRDAVIVVDEASMLSNDQTERLVQLANRLEVGRLAFVGDVKQLGAVEAGKPFEVMQSAGAPAARMTENIRARADDLREAARLANENRITAAFGALQARVREVGGEVAERAAADWIGRSPEERERTLIMTSGRMLRDEINLRVQGALREEGTLKGEGFETSARDRVHATNEELRSPRTYEAGMVLELGRGKARGTEHLRAGEYWIVGRDDSKGKVLLKGEDGRSHELKPRDLARKPSARIKLWTERQIRLHEGETIRWSENDHKRGLFNADRAKVLDVGPDGVTLETAQGLTVQLQRDDPMLKRLDLAYAMNTHQLQGATADKVIAAGLSRETNLNTARMFLVNITRPRDDLTLYVDDRERYARNVERHTGDKTSALETIAEILPQRVAALEQSRARGQAEPGPTGKGDTTKDRGRDPPVRERQIELGL